LPALELNNQEAMKRWIIFRIVLLVFLILESCFLKSQNGLENIIIEKYYISAPEDTLDSRIGGYLPIGSVTYRIFVDMLPGYRFYAAYGNQIHELRLETSTKFFNNEDIGRTYPNGIPLRTFKRNTVMLDSWLSVGSAGEEYWGVPKEEDDTLATIRHQKQFLQSENKQAGIPVKYRDGLKQGFNLPLPSFFGIDSLVNMFMMETVGSSFVTRNGAWGALGGSVGADSLGSNKVLIAQMTTDGDFLFELNIQIGKPGAPVENYVAKNPSGNEICLPFMSYRSKSKKNTSNSTKKNIKKENHHKQKN
jgi:hypothetical protein